MNMLWWIFCGAAGLWIGMPNPVASFPAAALLYPASLFLLGTGSTSWKHAFRLGWLCGLAGASACLYWLAIPVHDFGGLPWALAAPCPLLMGAYIGLYGGLFAALAHALRGEPAWRKGVALGLGWYLMECFRGWFFTGFPWITLASAFTPWTPVIQLASVIGAYGLGGLLAGLSCLCVEGILRVRHPHALRKRWLPALGGSLVGIFLVVAFGVFSLSFAPSGQGGLWVSLEQGNLDQNVKWEPAMQRLTVRRYLSLSAESLSVPESERPELLIWPETAMPFDYQTAPELSAAIRAFARDRRVALLFGAPGFRNRGDGVVDAFNRAYLIAPNGVGEGWYDKEHLVPFGEYVPPFLDLPFLRPLLQGVGEFLPGESTGPLVLPATPQLSPDRGPLVLGVLICYESIFPELARKQVAQGATLLVNISNDAWFGRSSAPEQHLSLGILRAVEQRRWIARSTNTGISAFVDPTGAVVARSGLFKAESLSHPVVPLTEKSVFFTLEPWLPWAGLALFLTFFTPVLSRFRRHI